MNTNIKPAAAFQLFTLLGSLVWRPLTRADYCAFSDAGDDARIAEMNADQVQRFENILGTAGLDGSAGAMAVMGGDATQLEIHGTRMDGDCYVWTLPLTMTEGF